MPFAGNREWGLPWELGHRLGVRRDWNILSGEGRSLGFRVPPTRQERNMAKPLERRAVPGWAVQLQAQPNRACSPLPGTSHRPAASGPLCLVPAPEIFCCLFGPATCVGGPASRSTRVSIQRRSRGGRREVVLHICPHPTPTPFLPFSLWTVTSSILNTRTRPPVGHFLTVGA